MKLLVTLTPAESCRLIAKAVVAMPCVQDAKEHANLIVYGGTTNAFVVQELLHTKEYIPSHCTVGINTSGRLCLTSRTSYHCFPNVFSDGRPVEKAPAEAIKEQLPGSVVIKGSNAVDPNGFVGILTSADNGGSVASFIGPVKACGIELIVPVGLEKMIPSVPDAARALGGRSSIDYSMGAAPGMYCLSNATIVTEIDAFRILFKAEASLICCGGVGGNEGAVTLAVCAEQDTLQHIIHFLDHEVKGEPAVSANPGDCETCGQTACMYYHRDAQNTPAWF